MNNIKHSSNGQNEPSARRVGFANLKDAAEYLRVSEKTVRRLIKRGFFKPSKAIRKIIIPWAQLENFYSASE